MMSPYLSHREILTLPRLPLEGHIDLTYRCNNTCLHCWVWEPPGAAEKSDELSYDEIRHIADEYLRRCALCFLKGLCEQCPGKSWSENGTLDTPVEYLCEVAHVQARHLGWLGESEHGWEVTKWRERVRRIDSQGPDTG